MYRSILENACIVSAINLDKIKEFSDLKIDEVVFAGGASKGELWCQILADVTGCRVKIPKVTEATALGTAMVAGIGAGVYSDISGAVDRLVSWDRVYTPDLANHEKYTDIRVRWQKIYDKELKLVDEGLTESMWKAPGI
jgi:autoinducer 2 (AI-2) kinase